MDVDFDNLRLTFSYILGAVLREELAKRGAVLRDRDVENNPDFKFLNAKERWLKRVQEGKRILYDVVDPKFVKSLFNEFKKIHASGFLMNDIKYGNIIIEKESGKPYLIDFELASDYRSLGRHFRILHDGDIEQFNLHSTQRLTYKSIRERLKVSIRFQQQLHAPIYLGAGLRIGPIWDDTDMGVGIIF
jgi:serine/threonine protein kinase